MGKRLKVEPNENRLCWERLTCLILDQGYRVQMRFNSSSNVLLSPECLQALLQGYASEAHLVILELLLDCLAVMHV